MKILIFVLFVLVLISLGYSLYLMMKGSTPEDHQKFNIALRFRVGLSIVIILTLLISHFFGWVDLHGVASSGSMIQ